MAEPCKLTAEMSGKTGKGKAPKGAFPSALFGAHRAFCSWGGSA